MHFLLRRCVPIAFALLVVATTAQAQFVISPRPGLVHHFDGTVIIDTEELGEDSAQFRRVVRGEILTTEQDGRCEVLLGPGSVLRVGPGSSIRLLSDDINDLRLELLAGSAIVDWDRGDEETPIRLVHDGSEIELREHGLYRLDANPESADRLRVFSGEARLQHSGTETFALAGQSILLGSGEIQGFDRKQTDSFDVWNRERSRFISNVNSLARSRNQQIVAGFRKLGRHLGNSQSHRPRSIGHKGPHSFGGHRRDR